jgi:hypothetical protein
MIDVLFEAVFTIVVEAVIAALQHDFPDAPSAPERARGTEVAAQSLPSHPLWDREIDGH